jgi:hypothetical protein
MYLNGKMLPVETIPGMGREGDKEDCGKSDFKYDIFNIL